MLALLLALTLVAVLLAVGATLFYHYAIRDHVRMPRRQTRKEV
jgi:type II secretory pathway component PulJ